MRTDPHHWGPSAAGWDGPFHFMPFLGGLMFLLLLIALLVTGFILAKRGYIQPPRLVGPPEAEARKILAERFARGDISTDEFMERAAVLNWTPGVDSWSQEKGRKKDR